MPFHDIERKHIEKTLDAWLEKMRPPPAVRAQLDFAYDIRGQSVELFEVRPQWDNKDILLRHAFAKATYIKAQDAWKIYWMRQTLQWKRYEPEPLVRTLSHFLDIVQADQHHCFFG